MLFLSDNGAHPPISDKEPFYPGAAGRPDLKVGGINSPLRGFKTQVYEGGLRTPAIAQWPAKWKPATISVPLSVTDWMPTLCALAEVPVPASLKPDGADISPLLAGAIPEADFKPHLIYSVLPSFKSRMVRSGPWKFLVNGADSKRKNKGGDKAAKSGSGGDVRELFHLEEDISESKNLIADRPEIAKQLSSLLARFAADDQPSPAERLVRSDANWINYPACAGRNPAFLSLTTHYSPPITHH